MLSLKSNCAQRYYENTLKKTLNRGILTARRLCSLRGTSEIQSSMYKTPHVICVRLTVTLEKKSTQSSFLEVNLIIVLKLMPCLEQEIGKLH